MSTPEPHWPYVRSEAEARGLVASSDPRVAVVLAYSALDPARKAEGAANLNDTDRTQLAAIDVAAFAIIELCRLGYRIGWDSAKAAARVRNEAVGCNDRQQAGRVLARELVDGEYVAPWPP